MKDKYLSKILFFILILIFLIPNLKAQDETSNMVRFNASLKAYVDELLLNFGNDAIRHERFLVNQIRMLNDEIKSRVGSVSNIHKSYFERLESRLGEVRELKDRLSNSGSFSLNNFINDIEKEIDNTIKLGIVDFKKQKVIEEAVQLLYVAEEMIKLDPNSSLEEDPGFNEEFRSTRQGFVQSFGRKGSLSSEDAARVANATIFDVYKAWRFNNRLEYQVRWTDVQIIKNRLVKNGSDEERKRMFERELRQASEMFNFGFYDLSERLFGEIVARYNILGMLDDCLYYKGESNYALGRYNQAEKDFQLLLQQYPSSSFISSTYTKLMYIASHFENYEDVFGYLNRMQAIVSSTDTNLEEARFLGAIAGLHSNRFDQTVSLGFEIPASSEYYRETRFAMAEAYAGAGNFEESVNIFNTLLQEKGIEPNFRSLLLLKLGYLNYEFGDYTSATQHFDKIPGQYPDYDRVLIGYAWAHYKQEIQKENTETRDFAFARENLEILVDIFYGSDYYLEAKTLLAYIYQLEQNTSKAIDNFEYAYLSKDIKQLSDDMNNERDQLLQDHATAVSLEKKALEINNISAFNRAYSTKKKIKRPLNELTLSDLSSSGMATRNEVKRLNEQLAELDRLKTIAAERENKKLVDRIEEMQLKIYRAVNSIESPTESELGFNYFDEHPFARKESMIEHENSKIQEMRDQVKNQKMEVDEKLAQMSVEIENAKSRRDYQRVINLEISRDRFVDLKKKLDLVETRTYTFDLCASKINVDEWSDYGAFGMANVNFAVKKMKAVEITNMLDQIDQINQILEGRKDNIEHQIDQINTEITIMTRRVKEQERRREREEMKRRFEESYFDTHDSELDYTPDTTTPPKIDEQ